MTIQNTEISESLSSIFKLIFTQVNNMKQNFRSLLIMMLMGLLFGCASTHKYIVENSALPTEQKISFLKEHMTNDEYDPNSICKTLLECAVYTNDIELAEWMFTHWKGKLHSIVRDYTLEEGEQIKLRYVINSPMQFGLSDEDAVQFTRLMQDNRFSTDICGYGYQSPMTTAYINNYPKTFSILLDDRKSTPEGKADLVDRIRCKFPIEALDKQWMPDWDYDPSLLMVAINQYDGSQVKSLMFKMLLDAGADIQQVTTFRNTRCNKYAGSSALAYAACRKNKKAFYFLVHYYNNTERLDPTQRSELFAYSKEIIRKTPSASELQQKAESKARAEQKKWEKYRNELQAGIDNMRYEATLNTQREAAIKKMPHLTVLTCPIHPFQSN
ncbi:MAG: hypothetical protein ACI9T7_003913 [Oleiphilaceae bacterium]|jgi:hypothetical protein